MHACNCNAHTSHLKAATNTCNTEVKNMQLCSCNNSQQGARTPQNALRSSLLSVLIFLKFNEIEKHCTNNLDFNAIGAAHLCFHCITAPIFFSSVLSLSSLMPLLEHLCQVLCEVNLLAE